MLVLSLFPLHANIVRADDSSEAWNAGHYVIKYNTAELAKLKDEIPEISTLSNDSLEDLLSDVINAQAEDSLSLIKARVITSEKGEELDADTTLDLLELGVVDYVEPDIAYKADATPNDPLFSQLWGMHQSNNFDIDAPEAWDVTTGDTQNPVVVGVIDTGIDYNHTDLAANMWVNSAEKNGVAGVDDDANGVVDDIYGYNAITGSGNPIDDMANTFHGTHCAGTIGGVGNNGVGVVGVAWNVKLMALKFLSSSGSGWLTDAIKAVQYAVMMRQRGVNLRVLSNSWGGGGYAQSLYDAIAAANNAGMLFTAAAGNNATNTDASAYYPQGYNVPNVVSVAAADSNGALAYFSNYGATTVDLAAPGVSILSAKGGGTNAYQYLSGTSMATPHVSGVAAILFGLDPTLTPSSARQLLMNTVKPDAAFNGKMVAPGFVDVKNVVNATHNDAPTIAPIANQTLAANEPSRTVPISVADADGNVLTVTAQVLVPDHRTVAAAADQMWQFTSYDSTKDNSLGMNEKHLYSSTTHFILLSNGTVYRSDPTYLWLQSAAVDPRYYISPNLLVTAYPANSANFATVAVSSDNKSLTITPAPELFGEFDVTVTVSDGRATASTQFQVAMSSNRRPVIAVIPDQITAWQIPISVPISVSDLDNDTISLSVAVANTANPAGQYPGLATITNRTLRLDGKATYSGNFTVTVTARDSQQASSSRSFSLTLSNSAPVLTAISDKNISRSTTTLTIPLSATDANDDLLNYSAHLVAPASSEASLSVSGRTLTVAILQQRFSSFAVDVTASDGDKSDTKRFTVSQVNAWPVIAPISNASVRWRDGVATIPFSATDADNDTITATVTAALPGGAFPGTVAVSGSNVVVTPPARFVGTVTVLLSVSDGTAPAQRQFQVTFSNQAPVLSEILNQNVSLRSTSISIPLAASDEDSDPLTFSTRLLQPIPTGASASISNNQLVVGFPGNYLGMFRVEVSVTDSISTVSQAISVTRQNQPPVIQGLVDKTVGKTVNSVVIPFTVTDPDGDTVSVSTYMVSGDPFGVQTAIVEQGLQITFANNFLGSAVLSVNASDQTVGVAQRVTVTRQDNAPVMQDIANREAHWSAHSIAVPLSATDEDGDQVSFSGTATLVSGASFSGSVYVDGSTATVYAPANFVGTALVTITASDGIKTSSKKFQATFSNTRPNVAAVANKVLKRGESSVSFAINATDADDDQIYLSARVASGGPAVGMSITGSTIAVSLPSGYYGTFSVEVNVSDGAESTIQSVQITRENSAPTLQQVSDIVAHWNAHSVTVPLVAADADNDNLSLSASAVSATTFSGTLRFTGSTLTITPTRNDYIGLVIVTATVSDGLLNNSIQFRVNFQNNKPQLPALTNRTVGTNITSVSIPVTATDADGDTLTYSARVMSGALSGNAMALNGQTIGVTLSPTFAGAMVMEVSVTDGAETDTKTFSVTKQNTTPVLQPITNQSVHWKSGPVSVPLSATDGDNDTLTLSAATTLASGGTFSGSSTITGSILKITPPTAFVGQVRTTVTARDGLATAAQQFTTTFNNSKPQLSAISSQKVSKNVSSVQIPLAVSDADNDPLTITSSIVTPNVSGVTSSISGSTLTVAFSGSVTKSVDISVTATDGAESTVQTAHVTRDNFAPDLRDISDMNVRWNAMPAVMSLFATDADNDTLTYSATAKTDNDVAYELDQAHHFFFYRDYYLNWYGKNEKSFRGDSGNTRFYITPSGELYQFTSSNSATVALVGKLGARYYDDPSLMFNVQRPADSAKAVATLAGTQLSVTSPAGFTGAILVKATVDDGFATDSTSFYINVTNSAPQFPTIADTIVRKNVPSVLIPIGATDTDQDTLSYSAQVLSPANSQATLTIANNYLAVGFASGFLGTLEIDLSVSDGIATTHKTVRVGRLNAKPVMSAIADKTVHWTTMPFSLPIAAVDDDGDTMAYSATVKTHQQALYDLDQLHDFYFSEDYFLNWHGRQEKYVHGDGGRNRYMIYPNGDFYLYNPSNFANSTFLVRLPKRFYDDPSLLFNAARPTDAQVVTAAMSGSTLQVSAPSAYVGQVLVTVSVSDGELTDTKQFYVNVDNTAPQLASISNQTVGKTVLTFGIGLRGTDADNDTIQYSARLVSAVSGVTLRISGNTLVVTFDAQGKNSFSIEVSATDGADTAKQVVSVSRQNFLPYFAAIAERNVHWSTLPITVPFTASDDDGDSLTFSASATAAGGLAASATISGSSVIVSATEGYVGAIQVTLTVNDGDGTASRQFTVNSKNTAPTIADIANIVIGKTVPSQRVTVSAADADNDQVTLATRLVSGSSSDVQLALDGSAVVATFRDGYQGTSTIEVSANDGAQTTKKTFSITRKNLSPALSPLQDVSVSWKRMPMQTTIIANDPDGDALNYTVHLDTVGELAYQLDQAHNFYVDTSYNYNWHGRQEKYLKGDSGRTWYFLYSDGSLYKLMSSNISTAAFIAKLQPQYYEDPSLLINVVAPINDDGVSATMSDSVLTVSAPANYVGNIHLAITVSDGSETDSKEFNVSVVNNAPDLGDIPNKVRKTDDGPFSVTLNASDEDDDALTLTATVEAESQLAYNLDSIHNFYFQRSFYYDFRGGEEKYFRGNQGWYLILPSGKLYLWTGSSEPTGTLLGTLDRSYYENPYLLFDVPSPTSGALPATVSISGNTLTVIPDADFSGVFAVNVLATDGSLTTTKRFEVTTVAADQVAPPADQALDSDGDGVSDVDEIAGGTDRFDAGSFLPSLKSPVYVLWNGFLNMTNIVELVNPNQFTMNVKVSLYSIDGVLMHVQPVSIDATKQYDLILNSLPGFAADSYGIAKIEFEGVMDGRISFYRNDSARPGEFEFAFSVPFADPSQGTTAVSFNTFQPSLNPTERNNIVANWLTIVNFATVSKSFKVKTYNQAGEFIVERSVTVPGFGRVDIDGGHGLVGPSVVGMHVIVPKDPRAAYTAQLTRYAGNTDGSVAPNKYSFAFPLVARAGTGRQLVMPMSRQFGESNWVELINTSNASVQSTLRLLDTEGHELFSEVATLPAHAQKHYEVSSYLLDGQTGIVLVNANKQNALVMQSMVYFRDTSGSVQAMYGSQGKEAIGHAIFGSYNRFLGMENWLKVVNYADTPSRIKLVVNSGATSKEEVFTLPAFGSVVLPIHDGARFGTSPDSYGTVELRIAEGANFFSELLRIKRAGNDFDIAAPTTVR